MSATIRSGESADKAGPASEGSNSAPSSIGKSLKLDGNLNSDEAVTVHGHVKGKVKVNHTLTIGREGVVLADIDAREVVVMGRAEGTIRVGNRITIMAGGQVNGDIHSDKIIIQEGAIFQGNVNLDEKTGK